MTRAESALRGLPGQSAEDRALLAQFAGRFEFREGAILINVPLVPIEALDLEVARNRGYFALPPVTQFYLAAAFKEQGVPAVILDLNYVLQEEAQKAAPHLSLAWEQAIDAALERYQRPLVCVSLMFESTLDQFAQICRYVRSRKPSACLAAGGVAATSDPERLLHAGLVDVVFSHEAEATLPSFYRFLDDPDAALPVNLSCLADGLRAVHTPKAKGGPIVADLREAYRLVPLAEYRRVGSLSALSRMRNADTPSATLLTRRGCRARCAFCGVRNFNGAGVRVRTVEDVLQEMAYLHGEMGIRHFDFLDDDLIYDEDEAVRLFDGIASLLPGISWVSNNGLIAASLNRRVLAAMRDSGCTGFKIGLETGNAALLRKVHKPTNLEKFFALAQMMQEFPEMFVAVNFIIGMPGETFGQMTDSLTAALRAGFDWNNFYLYQHLKNTEFYESMGGLAGGAVATEDSKDGQMPASFSRDINPVRAAAFHDLASPSGVAKGYDIFDLDLDLVPSREQLTEIWFTFNALANFIRMPALRAKEPAQLENGILWQRALSQAYPHDASIRAVLYALEARKGGLAKAQLESLRASAKGKFDESAYWRGRDDGFNFSALLEKREPVIDPRGLHVLGLAQSKQG
jgi:tRNA A37 methylthiotransferase MiaB